MPTSCFVSAPSWARRPRRNTDSSFTGGSSRSMRTKGESARRIPRSGWLAMLPLRLASSSNACQRARVKRARAARETPASASTAASTRSLATSSVGCWPRSGQCCRETRCMPGI